MKKKGDFDVCLFFWIKKRNFQETHKKKSISIDSEREKNTHLCPSTEHFCALRHVHCVCILCALLHAHTHTSARTHPKQMHKTAIKNT